MFLQQERYNTERVYIYALYSLCTVSNGARERGELAAVYAILMLRARTGIGPRARARALILIIINLLSHTTRVSIYLSPDRAASFDDNNYHNPPSHSKSLSSRILDLVADMLPLFRRLGKAALAIEATAAAGLYLVYRDLNSGGPEARSKWDRRVGPWLVDAFHAATGDDRVVDHRRPHPNPAFGKGGDP